MRNNLKYRNLHLKFNSTALSAWFLTVIFLFVEEQVCRLFFEILLLNSQFIVTIITHERIYPHTLSTFQKVDDCK